MYNMSGLNPFFQIHEVKRAIEWNQGCAETVVSSDALSAVAVDDMIDNAMSAVAVRNVAANTVASAVYTVTKEFYGLGLFT